eukprot:CAMPEP_0183714858 /NCGR_PEP_ID=MMETSP0737-20130205/9279_1 /TAXON_ID=385413 /ORGANISM="Thalassiosira miniscula, Strain CCMP1093" /LENGTH=465 /DNA_ID=CAMNT_0025943881 /DNA_START=78 /DNA_END=1475 /DNA_ORIENTATION=-
MRLKLLIALAALTSTTAAAFQTAPRAFAVHKTCLRSEYLDSLDKHEAEVKEASKENFVRPKTGVLSLFTTSQLNSLAKLKQDKVVRFNRKALFNMGATMTALIAAVVARPKIARAATPLMVSGAVATPLAYYPPGLGIVEMPGMRGIHLYEVGRLPTRGLAYFTLAMGVATVLHSLAGDGYAKMFDFMTTQLLNEDDMKDKELDARTMMFVDKTGEEEAVYDNGNTGLIAAFSWASLFAKCHLLSHHQNLKLDTRTMLFVPEEEGDVEVIPSKTSWDAYTHSKLDPLKKKKAELAKAEIKAQRDEELEKLEQANKRFQEQQYKQHHHPVHVARTKHEQASYLDTLAINVEARHDTPTGYLDTLSNAKPNTWDVYKHTLSEASTTGLKKEASTHPITAASEQAPKLALEAYLQNHPSVSKELHTFVEHVSTMDELKALDAKSEAYEDTVMKEVLMPTPVEKKSGVV